MALYAIGDLQGCYEPLERLLAAIAFDPARDRLWFAGDLVNRGPDSLRCLRVVRSLGEAAVTVLGNHDLHLLCVAEGVEKARPRDTLGEVLQAPDREELLAWLRERPLLHVEENRVLVHAGLLGEWTIAQARSLAAEVEATLRGPSRRQLLERMYGDRPDRWSDTLAGTERLRVTINAMTRLRMVDDRGAMALGFKGEPSDAPSRLVPWFKVPGRASRDHTVVFGHWSALGLYQDDGVIGLDSGCVWGRALTAVRMEDRAVFSVPCPAAAGRGG
jgi:bis(5'-nucleosyl)-tetraphosphatase (symmetrical)